MLIGFREVSFLQGDFGARDFFAASYDASGHFAKDRLLPCSGCTGKFPIWPAFDATGNLFVAGMFQTTFDIGSPPLVAPGNDDNIFVAKLGP